MEQRSAEARRAELVSFVEGRSDEEITREVEARGVETFIATVVEGIAEAFLPDRAAGQSAVIQYNVTPSGQTYAYQLKVADGKCEMVKGAGGPARVTLNLSLPNFLRLIAGKLNGMLAFMTGKLKLQGDMLFAQVMQGWFLRD